MQRKRDLPNDGAAPQGRSSRKSKESTHARIVEVGARAIRRHGFDGIGIADIMKLAGLTHGGFYAHFPSREAMLAELIDRAGAEVVDTFLCITQTAPAGHGHRALLEAYLSDAHVRDPAHGCPAAALGTEIPRQSPTVRRAATGRIKALLDIVARHAPDAGSQASRERALATAATMIGAVVLARAVDEPVLSDAILHAARHRLVVVP
ncbi:TetR/AcrR family transcriptional regulator [Acidovorax sp. FG27]|uniref:TetR/AcrR family transcriptional regulator n=1 Tax=Acidovorax sp. FG27 TaxID=3133652 RepID=UPI0030E9C456